MLSSTWRTWHGSAPFFIQNMPQFFYNQLMNIINHTEEYLHDLQKIFNFMNVILNSSYRIHEIMTYSRRGTLMNCLLQNANFLLQFEKLYLNKVKWFTFKIELSTHCHFFPRTCKTTGTKWNCFSDFSLHLNKEIFTTLCSIHLTWRAY